MPARLRRADLLVLAVFVLASLVGAEPATAAASASAASAAVGVVLAPGDLISVEVYGHPDLSGQVRIPVEGPASFPLIGPVPGITGMGASALAAEIKRRLEADYLHQATVTVTVREYSRRLVYVLGSVVRPAQVEILPLERLSALRAISACGGFLEEADLRAVVVVRDQPDGRTTTFPVGADPVAGSDVPLLPGDLVLVPRQDRIYVLGQVNRPGAVPVPGKDPLTLSKALSLAGGFDRYARETAVQLLRPGEAARTIDLEDILAGKAGVEDPLLRPGDTVFVPTRRY